MRTHIACEHWSGVTLPAIVCALLALSSDTALAQTAQELKRLTLEDLTRMEISTVSRAPEPASLVPAAVFVITSDDIRRAGLASLPELLRLAPGVQVARIDAGRWAIGMRGFGDRLARSMLVLIDGRAVYSPLFAGTYWEVQDVLVEDIERIEVIRGPGGTLWGANAVNGIISIITKQARDTQGLYASAGVGSSDYGLGRFRYGAALGQNGYLRGYVKGATMGPQFHADGMNYDSLWRVQTGFRGDWALPAGRALTVQGDVYTSRLGERSITTTYTPPFSTATAVEAPLSGGNVLARLSGRFGTGANYQLQTYYDRTDRDERPVAETRDTFDVDYQQHQPLGRLHAITWGAGYRVTSGRITAIAPTEFIPPTRTDNLFSAFVQDDVALSPSRLLLTVGAKLEHNAYSGFELQPSGRVSWAIDADNTLFGSLTRAVRTPSRVETDYTTTSLTSVAGPTFVRLLPNPDFVPEELIAYEVGHRIRVSNVYVTTSGFFNQLTNVLSTELGTTVVETSPGTPRLILPVRFLNGLHGNSHGVELTGEVRPASWWRSAANYSFVRIQLTRDAASSDVSQERRNEGLSPRHQFQLSSSIDLPRRITFDWHLRAISGLRAGPVPAYSTSDVRLAWQSSAGVELSVLGQNLHRPHHLEWRDGAVATELQRAAVVTVTLRH
jgi:iron complex outermembrane recepter protein